MHTKYLRKGALEPRTEKEIKKKRCRRRKGKSAWGDSAGRAGRSPGSKEEEPWWAPLADLSKTVACLCVFTAVYSSSAYTRDCLLPGLSRKAESFAVSLSFIVRASTWLKEVKEPKRKIANAEDTGQ